MMPAMIGVHLRQERVTGGYVEDEMEAAATPRSHAPARVFGQDEAATRHVKLPKASTSQECDMYQKAWIQLSADSDGALPLS